MSATRDNQRGSVTVEHVIVFPVLLFVLFGVVQGGLWFHHRNIALSAAQEGARASAVYQASTSDGINAATEFAVSAGASNPTATVTRGATAVTVSVSVSSPNILPALMPASTITQSAMMPIERIS